MGTTDASLVAESESTVVRGTVVVAAEAPALLTRTGSGVVVPPDVGLRRSSGTDGSASTGVDGDGTGSTLDEADGATPDDCGVDDEVGGRVVVGAFGSVVVVVLLGAMVVDVGVVVVEVGRVEDVGGGGSGQAAVPGDTGSIATVSFRGSVVVQVAAAAVCIPATAVAETSPAPETSMSDQTAK